MRHVSEHEWELLKQQTARHLRDRSWLGGGHSIVQAVVAPTSSEAPDSSSPES